MIKFQDGTYGILWVTNEGSGIWESCIVRHLNEQLRNIVAGVWVNGDDDFPNMRVLVSKS